MFAVRFELQSFSVRYLPAFYHKLTAAKMSLGIFTLSKLTAWQMEIKDLRQITRVITNLFFTRRCQKSKQLGE